MSGKPAGRKKKLKKGTTSKRKKQGSRASRSSLRAASLKQLEAELERRQANLAGLHDRRRALLEELSEVDAQIAALSGRRSRLGRPSGSASPNGRDASRPRARNSKSLADALADVLANATLSVSEAAEAVQLAGYETKSANFRTIVNQSLLANPERFEKVGHGRYRARKGLSD